MAKKRKFGCLAAVVKIFGILMLIGMIVAVIEGLNDRSTNAPNAGRAYQSNASEDAPQPTVSVTAFDPSSVSDADVPRQVTLKSVQEFTVPGTTGSVTVPVGARVDVVGRSGNVLTLRFLRAEKQLRYTETTFEQDVKAGQLKKAQIHQAQADEAAREQKAKDDATAAAAAALRAQIGQKPVNSAWDGSVREVKDFFQTYLKDPDSAHYIYWSPVGVANLPDGKAWGVFVKFRSKNSFGGYELGEGNAYIRNGQVIKYEPLGEDAQ